MKRALLPVAFVWIFSLACWAEDQKPGASDAQQPCFNIFGHVDRQGKYAFPISGELTISQAIALAGGFAPQAQRKHVHIIRKVKGEAKPLDLRVDMDAVLVRKEIQHDITIRPNDVIIVKEMKVIHGTEAEGKKQAPPPDQKEGPKANP